MSVTVSRPGDWIGGLFPPSPTREQLEAHRNIWWRVCLMHIPPRDPRFEFELEFGMQHIEAVLEHRPFNVGTTTDCGRGQHILFVFPERWMTTQEEYVFVPMLQAHPQIVEKQMTVVDLVTKSALIIGSFIRDDIRIVKRADEADQMGVSRACSDAWRKAIAV